MKREGVSVGVGVVAAPRGPRPQTIHIKPSDKCLVVSLLCGAQKTRTPPPFDMNEWWGRRSVSSSNLLRNLHPAFFGVVMVGKWGNKTKKRARRHTHTHAR